MDTHVRTYLVQAGASLEAGDSSDFSAKSLTACVYTESLWLLREPLRERGGGGMTGKSGNMPALGGGARAEGQ